mgnify:CR=1 FL=1
MAFVTDTANKILDKILRNTDFTPATTIYTSLHTADPGNTGTAECTGGSYARLSTTFSAASGGATANTADLNFTGMPACTVTHVGLWSAVSAGTFWWGGALTASKTVGAGDTLKIAAGDLDVVLTVNA